MADADFLVYVMNYAMERLWEGLWKTAVGVQDVLGLGAVAVLDRHLQAVSLLRS